MSSDEFFNQLIRGAKFSNEEMKRDRNVHAIQEVPKEKKKLPSFFGEEVCLIYYAL